MATEVNLLTNRIQIVVDGDLVYSGTYTNITIQNDDKVVVTGLFTTYDGVQAKRIIRLNPDGSIDNTFMYDGVGTGQSSGFNATAGRSAMGIGDGTIIVNSPSTNEYSTYQTGAAAPVTVLNVTLGADKTLIRISPDGSLNSVIAQNTQFEDGGAAPTTNEFVVQPDGKIICAGRFSGYNGNTVNCIVRMDALGTIDAAFLANTGTGVDPSLYEILGVDLMPNGWVMVGCVPAADFNGVPSKGLVRLTQTGALEPLWDIGTGFNSSVYVVCVDTFGDIIVGGAFTQLDGTVYNRVVKLT